MSLAEDLSRATQGTRSLQGFHTATLEFFRARWGWPLGQAFELCPSDGVDRLLPSPAWSADDPERFSDFRARTEQTTLTPGRGPAGQAIQTGHPVWIPDVQAAPSAGDDPRFSGDESIGLHGTLVLPIVSDGCCRGVLEFHDVRVRPSEPGLLESIRDLPTQLGWLEELARKADETRRVRSRMEGLVEAMEAIGATGLTPEEVMQITAERIQDLAEGATSAGVYEVSDEDLDTLVMVGASGNAIPFKGTHFAMSETVTGYAFQQGEVILVNDARNDTRVNQVIIDETTGNANLRAFVAVPLIGDEGRPVALLNLMSNQTHSFTEADVDLLNLLSRHMGSALDRARAAEANRKLLKDLTRTTEALQASLQRTEAILDASLHPIIVLDPRDRVVLWSKAAETLYGWSSDEVLGHPIPVVPERGLGPARASLERIRGGETLHNVDVTHRTKDGGTIEARVSAAPISVEGVQSGVVLVVTDMTEIRTVEARLLQAERMESVGRLAGGVAHDFNNMLTAIKGHAELLLTEDLDDEPRESVEGILAAADRSSDIVRQLLAYSRKRDTQASLVHPATAIPETANLLSQLLSERVALEVDLDPDAGPIRIDPSQLDQLVMNLVLNARDALPDGGGIRIESGVGRPPRHGSKMVRDDDARRWVRISVSDDGTGIPSELKARIFEPFFSTKNAAEGIGLGLATVHAIVSQAGGTIELESEVGEGTTFSAYFPLVEAEGGEHGETQPGSGDRSTTVLLVEDAEPVERLIRKTLAGKGLKVRTVASQKEAIRLLETCLQADETDPALVISDVRRGRMPVDAFLRSVRSHRSHIPVLLLSDQPAASHTDPNVRTLAKPFSPGSLANAVEELLDSGVAG